MIGAMTVGADFGGRLVYDYNAGGNACPQPIHFKGWNIYPDFWMCVKILNYVQKK